MKQQRERMRCPACGAAMNPHAYKVDYAAASKDPGTVDKDFFGIVEEFNKCPKCGASAVRRAD
jgi:ribosomal protein S27AE